MVFVDYAWAYSGIKNMGCQQSRINHSVKVYVEGDVHTDTMGFLVAGKRGIGGVYHQVSAKWLQSYMDE